MAIFNEIQNRKQPGNLIDKAFSGNYEPSMNHIIVAEVKPSGVIYRARLLIALKPEDLRALENAAESGNYDNLPKHACIVNLCGSRELVKTNDKGVVSRERLS